jgi:DNA-binding protein HU-beta
MNKAALIEKLSQDAKISRKQAEETLDSLVNTIIAELKAGREVTITGFGNFSARTRHARGGVNPQHPTERITIPEVKVAKFKTGKTLKDALKGKIQ